LALTRQALDLTQFQMARLIGTDVPTWGTYEAGLVRMPPHEALKLFLPECAGAGSSSCPRNRNCSASR
jgi:hypothetical protein